MARPISKGISYFPLDVDFMQNLKIRKVIQACGPNSIAIIMLLLGNIYGDEGYYMRWDEDVCFLITEALGVKDMYAREVVKKCLQVDFFDENLFDKYKIITSRGIQSRFFEITKRRKNNHVIKEYLLINVAETNDICPVDVNVAETLVNVAETLVNVNNNEVIARKSTQSKVKESKVNNNINTNNNTSLYKGHNVNSFTVCVDRFTKNDELKKQLASFARLRASRKKSFTAETFRLFLEQLKSLSGNDENAMLEILRASIMNGWINIYPLKDDTGMSKLDNYYMTKERQTDDFTDEELKDMFGLKGGL